MAADQEDIDRILPAVRRALLLPDDEDRTAALMSIAEMAFIAAYDDIADDESDPDFTRDDLDDWLDSLDEAMSHTKDSSSPEVVAAWIATAAENGATVAAAPAGVDLTWNTMRDELVRDLHEPMDGVTVPAGKPFDVGGHLLMYPGQPVGPPEVWINCRCFLTVSLSAAASPAADRPSGAVVVAVPRDPDALAVPGGDQPEDLHVTIGYYPDVEGDEDLRTVLEGFVASITVTDLSATVTGTQTLGDDDPPAQVLMLDSEGLHSLRAALDEVALPDQKYPKYTPHLTLGYGIDAPTELPDKIELGAIELWWQGERMGVDRGALDDAAAVASVEVSEGTASTDQGLVARAFDAAQRKRMADEGTAMPDGSYPIANLEDLRNAIQAIGRAKDPDAVKRHIRKRAKALGHPELIPDGWTASADDELTAAPGTRDGPGWLTNPADSQRLRNYWVHGKGAAKIGWGTPNDLTRCHQLLSKYVQPQWVWGTCQNLHKEALGIYNPESRGNRRGSGRLAAAIKEETTVTITETPEVVTAAAPTLPPRPREWFEDPQLPGPTPLTITADGRVVGHLATWGTCHVGMNANGQCVQPPRSNHDYAYFRTGEVETADGSMVAVGAITMNTGHATAEMDPRTTVAHYDNTGTAVARVAAGEDEHGIWLAGAMDPGVSEQDMYVLKATGSLSGDWRRIGGNLELVAALAVNVPGFPIPRTMAASGANYELTALTAAMIVEVDPNAQIAEMVAVHLHRIQTESAEQAARVQRMSVVASAMRAERVAAVKRQLAEIGA